MQMIEKGKGNGWVVIYADGHKLPWSELPDWQKDGYATRRVGGLFVDPGRKDVSLGTDNWPVREIVDNTNQGKYRSGSAKVVR